MTTAAKGTAMTTWISAAAATLALMLAHARCAWAGPDEARLLATLKTAYPGTQFDRVSGTPVPDLYEVWMRDNVAYVVGHAPRYFIFGRLFDAATLQDLTAAGLEKARTSAPPATGPGLAARIDFSSLPWADAIKTVRGTGRRQLAVFSDPLCVYCRALERELDMLSDVTVYYFMVPFQDADGALAVWCAADRAAAWRAALAGRAVAAPGARCPHPLDRNMALARQYGVRATPTLVFPDGLVTQGMLGAADIATRLASQAAARISKE